MTSYVIEVTDLAVEELRAIRAFDRRPILDAIRQQLTHEPTVITRNRKRLEPLVPRFETVPPIWELRVGEYRVFYDVDEDGKIVYVRAVAGNHRDKLQRRSWDETVNHRTIF